MLSVHGLLVWEIYLDAFVKKGVKIVKRMTARCEGHARLIAQAESRGVQDQIGGNRPDEAVAAYFCSVQQTHATLWPTLRLGIQSTRFEGIKLAPVVVSHVDTVVIRGVPQVAPIDDHWGRACLK